MTIREFETFALVAAAIAMWSQIRAWLSWPVSLLIVHRRVDSYSSGSVLAYLHARAKWHPRGGNYYSSERPFVRPLGRSYRVWYEALKEGRQTFWLRRRPVWYAPHEATPAGTGGGGPVTAIGMFSYLRGTLNWERLLSDAAALEDVGLQEISDGARNRFLVRYHGQSSFAAAASNEARLSTPPPSSGGNLTTPSYGLRLLQWAVSDLVERTPLSLDHMSLRPELVDAAARVRRWIDSKEWHEERGIPWRLGLLLSGAPGTGKTSLARGLAVEHNLPIHVFDLAALDNHGIRAAWAEMLSDAPCVALIEDIDAVFDGRKVAESVLKQGIALTFDALLNCISGVQAADGVLLIVTSNKPETLDSALLRPGRLDLHVTVRGLDHAGRVKMARRILGDDLAAARAADDPDLVELTPADFQERLCRRALADRFGDAA